jgi:hypothetical protein
VALLVALRNRPAAALPAGVGRAAQAVAAQGPAMRLFKRLLARQARQDRLALPRRPASAPMPATQIRAGCGAAR